MKRILNNISLILASAVAAVIISSAPYCYAQEQVEKKSTWKQALREQKKEQKKEQKRAQKEREREQKNIEKGKESTGNGVSGNISATPVNKGYVMGYVVEKGDTIYIDHLPPAYALNREVYNNKKKEWRKFYKLIYNFKKAYPYALQAKKVAKQVDSIVAAKHLTGKEQEEFVKKCEAELFKQFEKPLKNLTVSQGRLLMKLIDREIGLTTFYVIKNYKGRFKAFFWQGVARLFGSNLKTPYDRFGADKEVEKLVKMWEDGSFDALYFSIFYK